MNAAEIANKYQKKTDKQHILDNPDTYIGSVEEVDADMWVFDDATNRIVLRRIRYIPGLYKLFDEGLVNCRDHMVRMLANEEEGSHKVSNIQVTIDPAGMITMTNDGNGIDVVMHPETNVWVPEMIFGHLRTSTNYDKTEKKIVGGKNGFGVKLAYVWSTIGSVETVDHKTRQKYEQTFERNLDIIHPPIITKVKASAKPYTKITFLPDYARLGVPGLSPDMLALFKKRVYDLSAITDKSVKIRYNGDILPTKTFSNYIDLYIGSKEETKRLHEEDDGGRWEYSVAISPTHEFCQVSFVNGIHTQKGGKHVEYILNQITRKVCGYIETKKKMLVNPMSVKEQLLLFIRCDVENPSFDSQTKDYMNTPSAKFGSSCNVSDKFIEKLCKMGVMEAACALTELKETKASKKNDGVKVKTLRGMTKLMDASLAGTERSRDCVLILCEGDSAKAGIVSGLTTEDRATIGVFPLKGKLLNVRGESAKKINENEEIRDIKKILGLERERKYESMEDIARHLRYGQVLFMTDQDLDGSHIKGLCINLFQSKWKSLAMIPGFIGFMNTPILKARRGKDELLFYNQGEYDAWKEANELEVCRWEIKYYKGLGTSTDKEFKQYFKNKKVVSFVYEEESDDMIDMVFNKKRADDRKAWLEKYERDSYLNTTEPAVSYSNFINKELIHFSKYDCDRSIPNVMDGLKRSLRKILFSAFKKNLTKEIKVAQFSGYVSEHSGYHHGEASLNAAIVNMAQNFVGSNNINLFVPNGQFGSRMMGGKDSASERYIFTLLSGITRRLFPEVDDPVLTYLDDDGTPVEPLYYVPIIPMVLVNGGKGIGTGFSTSIPCYDPLVIISYLKQIMDTGSPSISEKDFVPYYEGFKGTIVSASARDLEAASDVLDEVLDEVEGETSVNKKGKKKASSAAKTEGKFIVTGVYEIVGTDQVRITELPIGTWTNDYKDFLEGMVQPAVDKTGKKIPTIIKDYVDNSTKHSVDMLVTFQKGKLADFDTPAKIIKFLRLSKSLSTNNMHLFDPEDKLKKYTKITEIIEDYFGKRLELYSIRKEWLLENLQRELVKLSNRARYIQALLVDRIDLRRKTKDQVFEMLHREGFDTIDGDYSYLTKMPMDSVTAELVEKIMREKGNKEEELDALRNKNEFDMWKEELNALEVEYRRFREERAASFAEDEVELTSAKEDGKKKKKVSGGGGGGGGVVIAKNKKVPLK
jgi:DNA topoisomerase-2